MPQGDSMARVVNPTKPRIFLADLEYAKKEEWERRRKLRLKQVRQQARDIATVIRTQAIKARRHKEIVTKCEKLNAELIAEESKANELEGKLSECLTSVGTAHSSATMVTEVDELVRHRTELQGTLARLRAELAAGKTKEARRPRFEVAEKPREGISISKVWSGKPAVRPTIKKYFPASAPSSGHNVPATPPNFISAKKPGGTAGSSESVASQPVAEQTIESPPLRANTKSTDRIEKPVEDHSVPDGRRSCPPSVTEVVATEDGSSDSDSGLTWPPASIKKRKPSKVRMYDHSARKCSEYVQQCGVVRMETPEELNMKELIQHEEDLITRKTDEELEKRRIELQRGVRALREEIAKQDWDSAIDKLCQFAKEKRVKKALSYPSGTNSEQPGTSAKAAEDETAAAVDIGDSAKDAEHTEPSSTDGAVEGQQIQDARQENEPVSDKHRPPVKAPTTLKSIVSRFNRQREAILNDESLNTDESESEEENGQLPLWLRAEVEAQNVTVRESRGSHPARIGTPETMMESLHGKKPEVSSSSLSSFEINEKAQSSNLSLPKESAAERVASQAEGTRDQAVSCRETSNSTSSGDINVEIRFNRKGTVLHGRTSEESERLSPKTSTDKKSSSPQKDSSSTSYYSPPDKLSPQQLTLLSGILSRMSVKNRNPVLHHYINRVLEMSRQSVSELDVSTSSELSIRSDLFKKILSTPLRPVQPGVSNLRFKDGNSSTAVSVSSAPQDSVGETSSSSNATEIATLLRNIVELQRLYRSATSPDPLSDSMSSYRSLPDSIVTDRCDNVAPRVGPVSNFCEDTGIFENQQKPEVQPMFLTIFDKDKPKIDVPSELFPKPIFKAPDRQPASGNLERLADVPDGYAMRPEHDPISIKLPKRGIQRVISSLSDIESEVSSIQSTPTKILGRRSPSAGSIASDKESTLSGISLSDFIDSTELQKNDLIPSSASSTDFEDVFQSLGLGWALSTLRRIRNARKLPKDDSSKSTGNSDVTSSSSGSKLPSYRHSTPLKAKGCSKPILESSENDRVPSLTPPNITLLCPSLQK